MEAKKKINHVILQKKKKYSYGSFSEAAVSQAQRGSGMCLDNNCVVHLSGQGLLYVVHNPQRCEKPSPDLLLPTGLTRCVTGIW